MRVSQSSDCQEQTQKTKEWDAEHRITIYTTLVTDVARQHTQAVPKRSM